VNFVVLNDARIWQRAESLWTPLLARLLFALDGINAVVTKGEFGDDWSSRFGLGPKLFAAAAAAHRDLLSLSAKTRLSQTQISTNRPQLH
jgi:hypothetical protein